MATCSPAPWRRENGRILDANGQQVALLAVRSGMLGSQFASNAAAITHAPETRESIGEVAIMLATTLKDYAEEPWAKRLLALRETLWAEETGR